MPYFVGFNFKEHQAKEFNIIGNEAIILNSGFVSESMNDSFKELFLSQFVWVVRSGDTLPVNVTESSLKYKTDLNDK